MIDLLDVCSTDELLTAWGRWASTGGSRSRPSNLGIKPCWDVWQGGQGTGCGIVIDQDIEMGLVDNAMAELKRTDSLSYKALKLRYRYSYSYMRLASHLSKILPKYARNNKIMGQDTAKSYVDEAIIELDKILFKSKT